MSYIYLKRKNTKQIPQKNHRSFFKFICLFLLNEKKSPKKQHPFDEHNDHKDVTIKLINNNDDILLTIIKYNKNYNDVKVKVHISLFLLYLIILLCLLVNLNTSAVTSFFLFWTIKI